MKGKEPDYYLSNYSKLVWIDSNIGHHSEEYQYLKMIFQDQLEHFAEMTRAINFAISYNGGKILAICSSQTLKDFPRMKDDCPKVDKKCVVFCGSSFRARQMKQEYSSLVYEASDETAYIITFITQCDRKIMQKKQKMEKEPETAPPTMPNWNKKNQYGEDDDDEEQEQEQEEPQMPSDQKEFKDEKNVGPVVKMEIQDYQLEYQEGFHPCIWVDDDGPCPKKMTQNLAQEGIIVNQFCWFDAHEIVFNAQTQMKKFVIISPSTVVLNGFEEDCGNIEAYLKLQAHNQGGNANKSYHSDNEGQQCAEKILTYSSQSNLIDALLKKVIDGNDDRDD